jgi:hypothetical protein
MRLRIRDRVVHRPDLRQSGGQARLRRRRGWSDPLSLQPFVFGANDPLGCDVNGANCNPASAVFDPIVYTEFDAWA